MLLISKSDNAKMCLGRGWGDKDLIFHWPNSKGFILGGANLKHHGLKSHNKSSTQNIFPPPILTNLLKYNYFEKWVKILKYLKKITISKL